MRISVSRSAGMLIGAAACAGTLQAKAQEKEAHRAGIFSLVIENDGIVLGWGNTRFAYTHVLRSREFKTQDHHDQFGALIVSVAF